MSNLLSYYGEIINKLNISKPKMKRKMEFYYLSVQEERPACMAHGRGYKKNMKLLKRLMQNYLLEKVEGQIRPHDQITVVKKYCRNTHHIGAHYLNLKKEKKKMNFL